MPIQPIAPGVTTQADTVKAARAAWAKRQADKVISEAQADGEAVMTRDTDSGYSYHTYAGERLHGSAWDGAEYDWDKCEAEMRRLAATWDGNAEEYNDALEYAYNNISSFYDEDLVEAVMTALEKAL